MKRIISGILIAVIIFSNVCVHTYAMPEEDCLISDEVLDKMFDYMAEHNNILLYENKNYCYMSFVDDFRWNAWDLYLIKMADLLLQTGCEPDTEKYMEVLLNIIATYELDNASDLAEQCKMDNLKSFQDYALDAVGMGTKAIEIVTSQKVSLSEWEKEISKTVSFLSCITDNLYNWVEALSNLEVILQNYSNYDCFLESIENKSEGKLKDAASILRKSLKRAMEIKLETYNNVSDTNYYNYQELFFDDIFFDGLRQIPDYETDPSFQFMVDTGDDLISKASYLGTSWELGKMIGTFVGDVTVGAEDLINRVLEMMAIYDISRCLQDKIYDLEMEFLETELLSEGKKRSNCTVVESYILHEQFLIGCRIRGEYCIYSIVANDAKLLSWANKKSATEAKEVYEKTAAILSGINNKLNNIKTILLFNGEDFYSEDFGYDDNYQGTELVDDPIVTSVYDLKGNWCSADGEHVFHFRNSNNLAEAGDTCYIDFKTGERVGCDTVILAVNEIKVVPRQKKFSSYMLRLIDGQLISDQFSLKHVPENYTKRIYGTWKGENLEYVFKENGQFEVSGKYNYWGNYFVVNDSQIVLSKASDYHKMNSYSLNGNELVIGNNVLIRDGEYSNTEQNIQQLADFICGEWVDTNLGTEEYHFYANGKYDRYSVVYHGEMVVSNTHIESGTYSVLDNKTVRIYFGGLSSDLKYDDTTQTLKIGSDFKKR